MSESQLSQHYTHIRENPHWRSRLLFLPISQKDFLIQVELPTEQVGELHVGMCEQCGLITKAKCSHSFKNGENAGLWNEDCTKLRCIVCGTDCT